MKRTRVLLYMLVMALCLALGGCTMEASVDASTGQAAEPVAKKDVQDISELPLKDDAALYEAYEPTSLVYYYITLRKGNAADGTNHTFEEVNSYLNLQGMTNVEKISTDIIFQVGDENGPLPGEIGYNATEPNAAINVRGRTSTEFPQKSYRIDLNDNAGVWRGQKAIALNKHPGDPTRLRNMVFFRLLQDVPDLTSLRTQFVQVFMKDETKAVPDAEFVDYGLYTQVELPNGRYLRNHSLSRNGNLYKSNMCELFRYEDKIRLATDPKYDLNEFSEVLEPKTSEDHTKLIAMLDAVNDYAIPIENVVEKYFDVGNLTSYLAFNLLMANPDSNAQNYLLYSPVNSDKWYCLLWDGDGALAYYEDELLKNTWSEADWAKGISDYWEVVLYNRMFRVPKYRQLLAAKVEQLHKIITPERIAQLILEYRTVVDTFTHRMPDVINLGCTFDQLELIYQNMPFDTDLAYQYFLDSLEKPMPFYLDSVVKAGDSLLLSWGDAYNFDEELVYYTVEVATDWSFKPETIVFESPRQLKLQSEIPVLPEGTYYWRVTAANESGKTQMAFDQVFTDAGVHQGMRRFTITKDGQVNNPQ
jgi:spore coat protein H